MSLLTIQQVSKSYFGKLVLDQISLQLDEGERLALIGQNGAGKTTLLRLIMGIEKPDTGSITLASRVIPGYLSQHFSNQAADELPLYNPELAALEERLRHLETKMAQDTGSDCDEPVRKSLYHAYDQATARFESAGGYAFRHRMQEMTAGLGLPAECLKRPLHTLSGGERMRVELARLLLRDPDLLMLDEPTNHLDFSAMEWLEHYLSAFKGSVIIVTHDRAFMNQTATATAELSQRTLRVWQGNYQKYLEQKTSETEHLDREIKNKSRELERQKTVKQTMLSHRNISGYHAREKVVNKMSRELDEVRQRARHLSSKQQLKFKVAGSGQRHASNRMLLEATDLVMSYNGQRLFSLDRLTLNDHEKTCLCGPNGCGKTTLLSILLGQVEAESGQITLHANTAYGHLGQHVSFKDETATLLSIVLQQASLTETQARTLLASYGFRDVDVYKKADVLSGGERARLYLCCLLLEQPDMLFLDEPTNHLDIESREILEQALREYEGAILAVSHDRYFIENCCQSVYGFISGRAEHFDSYQAYRKSAAQPGALSDQSNKDSRDSSEISQLENTSRQDQSAMASTGRADSRPQEETADAGSKNPAEARRLTAMKKKQLRDTEQQIESLETEKQLLEDAFGQGDDDQKHYQRYAVVLDTLETLYVDYVVLAEQITPDA